MCEICYTTLLPKLRLKFRAYGGLGVLAPAKGLSLLLLPCLGVCMVSGCNPRSPDATVFSCSRLDAEGGQSKIAHVVEECVRQFLFLLMTTQHPTPETSRPTLFAAKISGQRPCSQAATGSRTLVLSSPEVARLWAGRVSMADCRESMRSYL